MILLFVFNYFSWQLCREKSYLFTGSFAIGKIYFYNINQSNYILLIQCFQKEFYNNLLDRLKNAYGHQNDQLVQVTQSSINTNVLITI